MIAVCVASCRPEQIADFLRIWEDVFDPCEIHITLDKPKKEVPELHFSFPVHIYAWEDIEEDLQEKAWIIPRRTGAIRSYSYYKAWQSKAQVIVSLDDDVKPYRTDFLEKYIENLSCQSKWFKTITYNRPRGLPYYNLGEVDVVLSHGLWLKNADLDAPTQLVYPTQQHQIPVIAHTEIIPKGKYYSLCAMNFAFRRKVAPLMYQLLMGKDYGIDRFDDIWCGIISKKIIDHLGYAVCNGYPYVVHSKASNVFDNLVKEAKGIKENESFWEAVESVELTEERPSACYIELARKLPLYGEYWDKTKQAMMEWGELFN